MPEPARPTTVTVSPATTELTVLGATVQLSVEVRDQNATVMAGATVIWTSSAISVATVDASGLVMAAGNGTATITASAGSASGSAAVTVAVGVASAPDLVVGSPSVSNSSPDAGASFTLSATVRNQGDGSSAATTLRYYRSTDAAITIGDTPVGTDAVGALSASSTSDEAIRLTAPVSAGTYYYGACVESVTGESDTGNNCSSAVTVTGWRRWRTRSGRRIAVGERRQPGCRRILHPERHRTQPGHRFVGRDDAALLPFDRRCDHDRRHAGGHGRGGRPVGVQYQ